MLRVRIKAPFGAFRLFSAGSYRPTAPVPTYASVYGLLLNIAGIESRHDDGKSPMTLTASGLPGCQLALGMFVMPEVQVLFQQLHNYPVGTTGRDHAAETRGNKYNIQPISRELLSELDFCALIRSNDDFEGRIRQGLAEGGEYQPSGKPRYGIPFLGDNNLFLSHLQIDDSDEPATWLRALGGDEAGVTAFRLYTSIDRADNTKTKSQLFVVDSRPGPIPPDAAWVRVGSPA